MRIWVTGVGVVSPVGRGARATMDALVEGRRGFRELTLFELPGARARIAAEVDDVAPAKHAPPGAAAPFSRTDVMALVAAREALAEARLDPRELSTALAVGGSTTGMFENEIGLAEMSRDPASIHPLPEVVSHPLSSTADRLHEALGGFERVRSVCSACSSGANAIVLAAAWLVAGRSSRVLVGGADGLCRLTYAGFGALGALSPEPCRPFDARRSGLSLGEGAAFLVLETDASARARGAEPIAELAGWASRAEAHHITNPERSGATAARVIAEALATGGLSPRDVDYVNAHGTATPLNDVMEAEAIRAALGAEAGRVLVSSTKGQIGHTLAAAGAIEAVVAALAVARGEVPPTAGLDEIDPACRLEHVRAGTRLPVRAAVSNSFGFGGSDTSLVFAEPGRSRAHASRNARAVVTGGASVGPLGVLDAAGTRAYLDAGPPPAPPPIPVAFADHLDLARARRI
ncbi:MAG TPA: beta-ketoacyl-[acyl-carrier-protein] synthase family protein, partial [Minicystis sp.]|nr:beta-ketoacyl-[acyl-carrier-protein] synthase family protein [Minicystis sp.]